MRNERERIEVDPYLFNSLTKLYMFSFGKSRYYIFVQLSRTIMQEYVFW